MASATETFQGCWGKKALNILWKIWVLLLLGLIVAVIWSEPEAVICPTCMGFVLTQKDKVSSMDKSICQGVTGRIRSVKLAWNSVKLAWTTVFKREPPFFSVNHGFPKTCIFCVLFAIYLPNVLHRELSWTWHMLRQHNRSGSKMGWPRANIGDESSSVQFGFTKSL